MKKLLIVIMVVIICAVGGFFSYEYYNDPKIVDGVVSRNIDEKGKPEELTTVFSPKDTVYFSAKGNRFWVRKAQVVWYKGKISPANRFLVEENVAINSAGYFLANLSIPEGLEEGRYGVSIYADGNDIVETSIEFDIIKK